MVVDKSQNHNIWYESLKGSIRIKSESRLSEVGKLNQYPAFLSTALQKNSISTAGTDLDQGGSGRGRDTKEFTPFRRFSVHAVRSHTNAP